MRANFLEEMQAAAEKLERGEALSDPLALELIRASSIGGARPKVLIRDGMIAMLSSTMTPMPS